VRSVIRLLHETTNEQGLKELVLSNLRIKTMMVVRELALSLSSLGQTSLQVLAFQGIKLNDPQVVVALG
jgi:hypothetical protein